MSRIVPESTSLRPICPPTVSWKIPSKQSSIWTVPQDMPIWLIPHADERVLPYPGAVESDL